MRAHRPVAIVSLVLVLTACGAGSLTVSEYAEGAEALVADMEARFATLDAVWESSEPSMEGARRYWEGRLEIRDDFLDGVEALDPPASITGTHATAIDLFTRITAADEALAARTATFETIAEHWQWVDTPEGRAADALLEEVFAFCRSSQAEFDATGESNIDIDGPWVPADVEIVKVAFGCPPQD